MASSNASNADNRRNDQKSEADKSDNYAARGKNDTLGDEALITLQEVERLKDGKLFVKQTFCLKKMLDAKARPDENLILEIKPDQNLLKCMLKHIKNRGYQSIREVVDYWLNIENDDVVLHVILEHGNYMKLSDYFKFHDRSSATDSQLMEWAESLANGLKTLHLPEVGIYHGNMNTDNIFVRSNEDGSKTLQLGMFDVFNAIEFDCKQKTKVVDAIVENIEPGKIEKLKEVLGKAMEFGKKITGNVNSESPIDPTLFDDVNKRAETVLGVAIEASKLVKVVRDLIPKQQKIINEKLELTDDLKKDDQCLLALILYKLASKSWTANNGTKLEQSVVLPQSTPIKYEVGAYGRVFTDLMEDFLAASNGQANSLGRIKTVHDIMKENFPQFRFVNILPEDLQRVYSSNMYWENMASKSEGEIWHRDDKSNSSVMDICVHPSQNLVIVIWYSGKVEVITNADLGKSITRKGYIDLSQGRPWTAAYDHLSRRLYVTLRSAVKYAFGHKFGHFGIFSADLQAILSEGKDKKKPYRMDEFYQPNNDFETFDGMAVDPKHKLLYCCHEDEAKVTVMSTDYLVRDRLLGTIKHPGLNPKRCSLYSHSDEAAKEISFGADDRMSLAVTDQSNSQVLVFPITVTARKSYAPILIEGIIKLEDKSEKPLEPVQLSSAKDTSAIKVNRPRGVFFDRAGNVVVTDNGNKRILVFKLKISTPQVASSTRTGLSWEAPTALEQAVPCAVAADSRSTKISTAVAVLSGEYDDDPKTRKPLLIAGLSAKTSVQGRSGLILFAQP